VKPDAEALRRIDGGERGDETDMQSAAQQLNVEPKVQICLSLSSLSLSLALALAARSFCALSCGPLRSVGDERDLEKMKKKTEKKSFFFFFCFFVVWCFVRGRFGARGCAATWLATDLGRSTGSLFSQREKKTKEEKNDFFFFCFDFFLVFFPCGFFVL
jgi:hypothetical protein